MKLPPLSTLALACVALNSCVYYTTPVPEMPYRGAYRPAPALIPMANTDFAAASVAEEAWFTTQPNAAAPIPTPATAPAPLPAPAPAPAASQPPPSTAITQPQARPIPTPATKPTTPAVRPTTAAAPTPKPASTPKEITNNGPIPVATPVPGDPTRVYNPLDSSKTIRITDKNGNIYPSGKELKVRGTNFHFYVP